jgi:putative DNA primase/helicase
VQISKKEMGPNNYLGAVIPLLWPPSLEQIPEALKRQARWVVWRRFCYPEPDGSEPPHWLILPLSARTGEAASLDDPKDLSAFEDASAVCAQGGETGPGFVLDETDPLTVVEIADAVTTEGAVTDEARALVVRLDSYTELMPDGRGLRVLVRAFLPPGGRQRGVVEMYESHRFVALTGWRLTEMPERIQARQAQMEAFHRETFPPAAPRRTTFKEPAPGDAELLMWAFRDPNGTRIERLYRGDSTGVPGDRTAADLALCTMLAAHTGNDPSRLDRLFRASALFREKWDQKHYSDGSTYGEATVSKALEGYVFAPPAAAAPPRPKPATLPSETMKETASAPETFDTTIATHDAVAPMVVAPPVPSPAFLGTADLVLFAACQGRAEGMAKREEVLTAHEAAEILKISPRLLRRTFQPWRRFGNSPRGDRWLLSQILAAGE